VIVDVLDDALTDDSIENVCHIVNEIIHDSSVMEAFIFGVRPLSTEISC